MIKCPNCSAELHFDPKDQKVKCEYCASEFDVKELKAQVKAAKEEEIEQIEGKSFSCSQCGATIMTFDDTAVTFCSYCGSQAMLESRMMKQNKPDYIIPFKVTKEQCIANYKKKLGKALFAPSYMKSDIVLNKFRGIYMPYGIYNLGAHGMTINNGEKYSKTIGNYTYYDKFAIYANVDADYVGISYDLSSKYYDKFSQAIPHNYSEAVPFEINYLSGFYADLKDVDAGLYNGDAIKNVEGDASNRLGRNNIYAKHGCYSPKVPMQVSKIDTGMFPVYFLAVRDKNNKYLHYAVVNGQTGEVAVDLPMSYGKYIVASLLGSIPIFLFLTITSVITPNVTLLLSVIIALISMIISNNQLNKLYKHEHYLDDKGYKEEETVDGKKKKKKDKMPFATKFFKYLIKQTIGICLSLFTLMINLPYDIIYYGVSIISFILILISFFDITKEHNLLVSRKIPQLDKRGGNK